jgi:hypothetical protein
MRENRGCFPWILFHRPVGVQVEVDVIQPMHNESARCIGQRQDRRAKARRSVSAIVSEQLPRRHAALAVLFHPREGPIGLHWLG